MVNNKEVNCELGTNLFSNYNSSRRIWEQWGMRILILLLLFSSCKYYNNCQPKNWKYGEKVIITIGFYKGSVGNLYSHADLLGLGLDRWYVSGMGVHSGEVSGYFTSCEMERVNK